MDAKFYFNLLFKVKKMLKTIFKMSQSLLLSETMDLIIEETCGTLECDRATVFIMDDKRNELWSQVKVNKYMKGRKGIIEDNKDPSWKRYCWGCWTFERETKYP